jgi:hypothetical protein
VTTIDEQPAGFGLLVGCNSYRNPDLVADTARNRSSVERLLAARGRAAIRCPP